MNNRKREYKLYFPIPLINSPNNNKKCNYYFIFNIEAFCAG